METADIIKFVLMAVLTWLAAVVMGGGIGALIAWLLRLIFLGAPGLYKPSMLFPGRTIVAGLLYLAWSPIPYLLAVMPTGLELVRGLGMVILMMMVTGRLLLSYWFPSGLAVRLIALARDMVITTVIALDLAGIATGWGLGSQVIRSARTTFDMSLLWRGWLILTVILLAFDLPFGTIQTILAYRYSPETDTAH